MPGAHLDVRAAIAAALLLSAPTTGLAQAKGRAAATPAARSVTAPVAVVAQLAPEDRVGWRGGLVLGWEKDSDAELAGPRLQLELERDLVPLGGRGRLSFVAAAGWFHGTREESASAGGVTLSADTTAELIELIPSFRASYSLTPRVRLFGELGVGGGWMTTKVEATTSLAPGVVTTTEEDAFAGVLRLSAGGSYQVNERLRLGVELPTLHKRYGQSTSQTLTFAAMAAYAF